MKKLLWTSAMALTAVACLTACDDSGSSSSSEIPTYKTESALPDSCEMEVAKAGDTYFACFENEWVEVTDSATVEKIKEGLDEKELKEQLEELEEKLEEAAAATKKSSSSKKVASSADADEGDVTPESSASEEECTGRRCGNGNSSSSKKSSGGSGNGGSGSGDSGSGSGSGSSSDSGVSSSDSEDGSSSSAKNSSSSVNNSSSSKDNSSSSVSSSSLKRHVNFSVIDDYVTWSEDGTKATLNDDISLTTLESIFTKANKFENLNITTRSLLTTANKALDRWGSFLVPDVGYFLTEKTVYATSDSNVFVLMLTGMEKGDAVYTDIAPQGKCGTSAYAKRTKFCSNGTAYPLCDGKTYDPTEQFCDTRGTGTLYKHVTIGEQTWMAENLKYEAPGSYCPNDVTSNCATYGRLYTWTTAVGLDEDVCGFEKTCTVSEKDYQGVCPDGWHVPSASEWSDLIEEIGGTPYAGKKLKSSTEDWISGAGTDDYQFTALPAGSWSGTGNAPQYFGQYAMFWTSTYVDAKDAACVPLYNTKDAASVNNTWYKNRGMSVRCIKNKD